MPWRHGPCLDLLKLNRRVEQMDGVIHIVSLPHRSPSGGYDEPQTLSFAISSICPVGADGGQAHPAMISSGSESSETPLTATQEVRSGEKADRSSDGKSQKPTEKEK
jgi:hypothetical protein